jgi:ADP-ribosylarginine hydrolase
MSATSTPIVAAVVHKNCAKSRSIGDFAFIFPNKCVEKYIASMILAGVGDAVGFYQGHWEFITSGKIIH